MDNKTFIENLSSRTGLSRKEATTLASSVASLIAASCEQEDSVIIPGFGTFETKLKAERIMAVPSGNGKRLLIPPKVVAVFKPSAVLKQRLNESDTSNSLDK